MYKIYMDNNSYSYLQEWAKTIKRYVVNCPAVAPKFQVFCKDEKSYSDIVLYVEKRNYGYKYTMKSSFILAKGKISKSDNSNYDFTNNYKANYEGIKKYNDSLDEPEDYNELINDTIPKLISLFCDAFLLSNAFLMYGNVINDKDIIASSRNSGEDKIIVFRPYNNKLYAVPSRYKKSPEGVFPVRGHFRHYKKSDKLVWIEEYMKGVKAEGDDKIN